MKFRIPVSHPALPGHFPGQPVVPGVVVLDHVLQAIAATGASVGALALPQVKFLQPLLPEQDADIALEPTARGWKFRVSRDGATLASGDIVAS